MTSLLQLAGIPREFGITLLGLTFALILIPYFAGHDFGVLKVPNLQWRHRRVLRVSGPIFFLIVVLAHVPIFPKSRPLSNSVAISPLTVATSQSELVSVAEMITTDIARLLSEDGRLKVASVRSARLLGEKEHAIRLGAELNVAWMVEGSLSASDGNVLIASPAIIQSSDGMIVWIRRYCSRGRVDRQSVAHFAARMAKDVKERLLTSDSEALTKGLQTPEDENCEPQRTAGVTFIVSFKSGTAYLDEQGYIFIDKLAKALQSEHLSKKEFLIEGHVRKTDKEGNDGRLSEARALAVKAALVAQGVDVTRLITVGKGSTEPLDTVEASLNNRITISVLE